MLPCHICRTGNGPVSHRRKGRGHCLCSAWRGWRELNPQLSLGALSKTRAWWLCPAMPFFCGRTFSLPIPSAMAPSPSKLLCSLACSPVYLGVTGFRCYLDQTCLIMFIPSTACVLFCWHLLGMQGTKEINNIHPNVFIEVGGRKKYWFWPCRLEIQTRGIRNVKGLNLIAAEGEYYHPQDFNLFCFFFFFFWRLSATPFNAGPQGRAALVVGACKKGCLSTAEKSSCNEPLQSITSPSSSSHRLSSSVHL